MSPEIKYDVAISFLCRDENIGSALNRGLRDGLDVFFYPHKQEELAGTNGLESMRAPFLDQSRVVVVLFREPWGETPWTRVEATAITDGCLNHSWNRLFFIVLDPASTLPTWLPDTHIRFNYVDFGLDQAIGAIKARVQERGGAIKQLSPVTHAELAKQEIEFREEIHQLRCPLGRDRVAKQTHMLFAAIKGVCEDVNASGHLFMEVRDDVRQCHMRTKLVSTCVILAEQLEGTELRVCEFNRKLEFPGEHIHYSAAPRQIHEERYLPTLNRAREFGWASKSQPDVFISVAELANRIVIRIIDLDTRSATGQLSDVPGPQRYARR